jgi:myo-inositol-1(or 4)-monophosphatase
MKAAMTKCSDVSALGVMVRAARLAGDQLQKDFSQLDLLEVREKGASDFVSSADLRSQGILEAELSRAFPDHALVLEEGVQAELAPGKPRFIADPLDGTTNFLHGMPQFAISIAQEIAGEVIAGVIFAPASGELFWAEKGRGAFLGERRIRVSSEHELGKAIVCTGIPHRGGRFHQSFLLALGRVMPEVAGIRRLGAAALDLAYVAAGRFEVFFEVGLKPWDAAAGALLVREAGGQVTKIDGGPMPSDGHDVLATSSDEIRTRVVDLLAPIHEARRDRN